mgnify:CR=1 FL=1
MMNKIKVQEAALRDECERLARAAERRINDPSLAPNDREAAMEEAKNYWQLSRVHADAVTAAEMVRPTRFSARNQGENAKTAGRRKLLQEHRAKVPKGKRAEVIQSAAKADTFKEFFADFEEALRFANRYKI